ncbi:SRPBCC family protein [Nocardioides donggukensis]|uniref:SRPBCC family protein n=1 Tax=Nocardioides donggukensis TaxID=2774019 RepID=A0A927Q1P0_9ACTN|nr:SRPBCC family protein [Nocardioides donggukensis]MBD8868921.1 SRPBCC family protein [Nocardioides donggukensis]
MSRFSAATTSEAVVAADRSVLWAALTDPDLLPRLTPFLESVTADGDHWCWQLTRFPVLGTSVVPAFTERMSLTPEERIEFTHDPPAGKREPAGAEGRYLLEDTPEGTRLAIRLEVHVELPLSRFAAPAVNSVMKGVMATMGRRFSANLLAHVGAA